MDQTIESGQATVGQEPGAAGVLLVGETEEDGVKGSGPRNWQGHAGTGHRRAEGCLATEFLLYSGRKGIKGWRRQGLPRVLRLFSFFVSVAKSPAAAFQPFRRVL